MSICVFSVLFNVKFYVCEHNRRCTLKINSNGGIKRKHVKSCPATT